MERTFNMGVGMVAVLAPQDADRALGLLAERGLPSFVIGQITPGSGSARLTGQHPA
jgi:phosphoribosylformylglycinamidine cyclo-ligase